MGKAQVIFLQEMRLDAPSSLPRHNPLLRLHHPFANRAHQAVLGVDTGILIRNTTWQIEETGLYEYATYARVRIPESEPAIGTDIRTLHLWSIHAPPAEPARKAFWNADVPGLARLDAAASRPDTAAIIGADWNAIVSPTLDEFPHRTTRHLLPLGQLAQAGLVDAFLTLYPTSVAYTRHNVVRGEVTGARRIDSIWTSHSLVPLLHSVTTRPSASDHSVVSVHLKSTAPSTEHGPGVWRLHRHAHHQPGFRIRMQGYAGMDGVTYPLIQCTSEASLQRLCNLANALLRGHQLPDGQLSLRGVLLPKKGDLSELRNYRPLSIAAATFRILGAVVANRLQAAAQEVISVSRTGFILGHHSARNVVTLYLLQHAVATGLIDHPIWVLNLDQQKAYDRVRHEWLLDCLAAYGFGPHFLTYVREIYRHPSLQHCVEGFFTDPIKLQCGILQGDPMSCLLYNFSLQPMLDFAQYHHHAGTQLRWDPRTPMVVSSLAFADDVLLIVNNKRDLAKFLDVLDLYKMTSNAKINEDKSQTFFFARSHNDAGDGELLPEDIPFPIIGDSNAAIVHLGYPFRLDGSVPWETLEKRFATIQAKVNILSTTNTTLSGRARICNSFLLSKLWHSLRLCPIPQHLQRRVNAILNPFLFLGRRNWIKHEYVVAPRHLGGLGVIDTTQMSIALFGQMVAGLLASTEPIGAQFRQALQQHLWDEYGALPAHFMLRRGKPWLLMVSVVTAQKSFMCRVVYTLTQLRLTLEPDWNTITVPELLSLPFHNDMYGYTWPDIHVANTQSWERNGLRVWGDYLWYNPNEKGKIAHTNSVVAAYPLVPPSASGIKNNYVWSRGHPENRALFSDAAGRLLPTLWRELWAHLNPLVARKLLDNSKHYRIHPDNSKSKKNPLPHDRPFDIDTVGLPFPWRFATLADKPIASYTTNGAWSGNATRSTAFLTSEAISDVFLFLHRRPWLAQKPRGERQLANHNDFNNDELAPRVHLHDRDVEAAADNPAPPNDAYEQDHIIGVASCMLCSGPHDSAIHGFIECPEVGEKAWHLCLPTLRKLVSGRGVPLDAKSIVLGWQDLRMPDALRHRLLLWQDLSIHLLSRRHHEAITQGLQNDHLPRLVLDNFARDHAALVAKTITDAYHRCSDSQRPVFVQRWLERGSLLKEEQGTLVFYPMRAPASTATRSES